MFLYLYHLCANIVQQCFSTYINFLGSKTKQIVPKKYHSARIQHLNTPIFLAARLKGISFNIRGEKLQHTK